MEEYSQEIVDNIKHEQEVHFTCYLPGDPEINGELEVKEVKIVLRKFDKTWKSSPELFGSYFVCGKCEYVSKYAGDVVKHSKVCETLEKCKNCRLNCKSEMIIECIFCDLKFNCNNCNSIHISQIHRNRSNWLCSKCEYKTSILHNLKSHYQSHEKKFSCETCEQKFSLKQQLKNHQQNHRHGEFAKEPEIKFECRFCNRSFATKDGLGNHERNVHSKLIFHCDVCGRSTKTKLQLLIHMQIHFKLPCPICHHLLAERYLDRHIAKHTTNPTFKCDDCDKIYFNKKDLNVHKSMKHKIQQVQCDLCNKIFKNKLTLRMHMGCHLMISCPTCSRSMSKQSMNQHKKLHLFGELSMACDIIKCRQKFSNTKELEEHRKIHIGPQIYICPNCNHQLKTLKQIESHMKCHQA